MRHPFYNYTVEDAIKLARDIIYFDQPGVRREDMQDPTPEQALAVIQTARELAGFNWITGRVAVEVVRLAMGEDPEKVLQGGF